MAQANGKDSDGRGTDGIVDAKTREARAGETGTTRFGMADGGAETDGRDTGGMVEKNDAGGKPGVPAGTSADQGGASGGIASGLQPGGSRPSGGPGTSTGSLGTGGGSNADEPTGSLKRWDKGQHEESDR